MHIRLLSYNPETNEFGVTINKYERALEPEISLPSVTKESLAGLELTKVGVSVGGSTYGIVLHIGPIFSVGESKVLPIGFDLFRYIMLTFPEYTEHISAIVFARLVNSEVKARIPVLSALNFESRSSMLPELNAIIAGTTVIAEAPMFVPQANVPPFKRKQLLDYIDSDEEWLDSME